MYYQYPPIFIYLLFLLYIFLVFFLFFYITVTPKPYPQSINSSLTLTGWVLIGWNLKADEFWLLVDFKCVAKKQTSRYIVVDQGFPKWTMTDTQGTTSSKGAKGGPWAVKEVTEGQWSHNLKLTLDILKFIMKS